VLHDAECPVWTTPHTEIQVNFPTGHTHQILAAVDLGPESVAVLRAAARVAQVFSAQTIIFHALPEESPYFDAEYQRDLRLSAEKGLSLLQAEAGTSYRVIIDSGSVAQAVHAAAVEAGADLIVIGRAHKHGGLGRLRSNTYSIVRESPCPVLGM
jgi:nucleotide-binding universal stress UspA family protein